MRYVKLLYEPWDIGADIERAIEADDYIKSYYLDEKTIGRVDYYDPEEGLFKVAYRQVPPPFQSILADHFRHYPGTLCEITTPNSESDDGLQFVRGFMYKSPILLESREDLYYDKSGKVVRRVKIGEDGEILSEERTSFDVEGNWLNTTMLDASGKVLFVNHRDDD